MAAAEAPGTPPGVLSCALQALGTVCLEASEPAVAAECFSRAMQAGGGGGREQPDTGAGGSGRLSLGDGRCLLARVAAFVQLGNTAPAESQLEAAIALAEATADQVQRPIPQRAPPPSCNWKRMPSTWRMCGAAE